ncbi:sugar phosphate isomerase/epimerase family protein [Paractinoplanes rishiriensis]|uniref:Xylose isomerase-like TIM barrel domain-containing protein n=1 Tax=Paractinoplanes rishiriensis TaxID=1050105 RepID=A0A919JXC6_9ACTN|nr:sugar phosphate isomerase/epimerase family protein [Actinoplanes rishiriensis]GIE95222.1 hypothetical protein Ari01nite_26870 [Actinoplanes rishiriensis]
MSISGTEYVTEPHGLTRLLADAEVTGADAIEVWYPENFGDDVPADIRMLRNSGVPVACVSSGSELGKADVDRDIALLRAAIDVGHRLGAPVTNTYFGGPGWRDDRKSIDRYARNVAGCLDLASELGLTVVLENEFDAFGHDPHRGDPSRRPESLRRLVDTIDHPAFGLNFDASNMVCAGVQDVPGALDLLADAVRYAHVKDVVPVVSQQAALDGWTAYPDAPAWWSTCPLGEGVVPWSSLFPGLVDRVTAITLEPHAAPHHRTAAFGHAMRTCRGWLARRS